MTEAMERVLNQIRAEIRDLKAFARKHENTMLAICLTYIKNRRKRPFHLGVVGTSVFLLMLLYGGSKKAVAEKLDVHPETIRQWLLVAGVGTLKEIEEAGSPRRL